MVKREVYSYIMTIDRKTRIFKLRTLLKDIGIKTNTTSQVIDKAIEISTKTVMEDKKRRENLLMPEYLRKE